MTRSGTSPRLATRTFFSILFQPPSEPHLTRMTCYPRTEPHVPLSGPRRRYGGGGGDGPERGQGYLYQVEDHERRNTLRQGRGDRQPRHHDEPDGPEGVDHGEACTSPEKASPHRPATVISYNGLGCEARYGRGDRVGEQVPSPGSEDHAEPTHELGEDRHADGSDEHVDRLRERPVARSEQEPGEDDRQDLQGEGDRREGQRYGYLGRHRRHGGHQRRPGHHGYVQAPVPLSPPNAVCSR